MAELFVGRVWDFDDEQRRVIDISGKEVVVFRHRNRFYALENSCLHLGGPVGEGMLIGKVETLLSDDMQTIGEQFSEKEIHIVCPWHGWEYNIETGQFAGDPRRCLRKFNVKILGDKVYVIE